MDGGAKEITKTRKNPCETAYFQDHVMSEEAMKANQPVQVHTHQKIKMQLFFFFVHWLSDPRLAATQSPSASDVGDIIMVHPCWNRMAMSLIRQAARQLFMN